MTRARTVNRWRQTAWSSRSAKERSRSRWGLGGCHAGRCKPADIEPAFFKDNAVYMTWSKTKDDLHSVNDKKALRDLLASIYPAEGKSKVANWAGQVATARSHR